MAKPKQKSKVVEVQGDGAEVYGFEAEPENQEQSQKNRDLSKEHIKEHAKFDKFKGEK